MKKKNRWLMIGAVVAAVSMFSVAALATTPNATGYDALIEVLKANHTSGSTVESATVNGSFTVKVDGETLLKANGTTKVGEAGAVSNDFELTLMGIERSGSMYSNNDEEVYFVDETNDLHYQVINLDNEHASKRHERPGEADFHNRPMNKAEEALLDFVVGDLKENFSVTNHADSSKTITLDVSKEEIPLPLRLLVDASSSVDKPERAHAPEVSAEWERMKQFPFFQGFEEANFAEQLPKLKDDVAIEYVRLQLTVDANNELQGVQGELAVSGKDEAGAAHYVEMKGEVGFNGINATTPDVYDSANKSIEIIDASAFDNRR